MPRVIRLTDRMISREELARLADFAVLWPATLPANFKLLCIAEMSESETESTGSGIFILEFANNEEGWISITQTAKEMKTDLADLRRVDAIRLTDSEIALYEEMGPGVRGAYFEREGVNIKLLTKGASLEEVTMFLSSLEKWQP